MKSKRNARAVAAIALLLTWGAAFAQMPPSSPRNMGNIRLRGGMPFHQPGVATAHTLGAGAQQPDVPALSLTWGIYTFPGSVGTFTADVNKVGHAVGGYGPNVNANLPSNHGFLLKGTKFTTIDYPGAAWTQPNAINDAGVIVGAYGASLSDEHGFKLNLTTYTSIDYPGATGTFALGTNKLGSIVGTWFSPTNPCCSHGFLLSGSVFTSIDYPGAIYTIPFGINKAGEIAGFYGESSGNTHGFLLKSGTFTTFDYPGYSQNYVSDINDSGVIAGGYGDIVIVNGVEYQWEHSYIYQSGTFTTFDAPFGPPAATQIWHMNNYGVVAGFYVDNSSTAYGFEATVGP
jgi:uncharacterized membrane protein